MVKSFFDIDPDHLTVKTVEDKKTLTYDNDEELIIQSPWFALGPYGLPRKNEIFKTDKERRFLKIPLNKNTGFHEWLKQVDEQIQKIVDSKNEYHPLAQNNGNFPDSFKVKFFTDLTVLVNKGLKQEKIQFKNLSEFEKLLTKDVEIRLLIIPNSLWEFEDKFGLSLRAVALEIKQKEIQDYKFE